MARQELEISIDEMLAEAKQMLAEAEAMHARTDRIIGAKAEKSGTRLEARIQYND